MPQFSNAHQLLCGWLRLCLNNAVDILCQVRGVLEENTPPTRCLQHHSVVTISLDREILARYFKYTLYSLFHDRCHRRIAPCKTSTKAIQLVLVVWRSVCQHHASMWPSAAAGRTTSAANAAAAWLALCRAGCQCQKKCGPKRHQ